MKGLKLEKALSNVIRKGFIAVLVGGLLLNLVGCGNSAEANSSTGQGTAEEGNAGAGNGKKHKLGLVIKTATNAHFQDLAYGAQKAAEDYGVELSILNTTTESDVEGQIKMCEDLISQGCDAILLTANDSKGLSSAVTSAYDNGVKFVAIDTTIDDVWGEDAYLDYVPTYIGVDHETAGYDITKAVCENIGGKGNVVIMRGVDATSSSNERTAGIKKALEEYPGITIVAEQSGNYDTETAQTKMGDILQSNQEVDAVICCNDMMSMGVVNALEEQGYTVGKGGVTVAGLDGNIVALNSIKEGKIFGTLYDWTLLQGYWGVYNAIQLLEGQKVAENIIAPSTVITEDNVEEFLPHANDLAAWKIGNKIN